VLVKGAWRGGDRHIDAALHKNALKSGERIVRHNPDGKSASTTFRPVASGRGVTLVEARPTTGRTHQIRVHAVHGGFPIAGDPKYGDREFNAELRPQGLKRLFLHASSISTTIRSGEAAWRIAAPLPDDLRQVLHRLDLHDGSEITGEGK
jgi:23S rRNA pseudouridine955/2504/2580 synthase